ncbi:MAG: FmdB family zinc ribbon protein [Tepidisphaerales bacterium]
MPTYDYLCNACDHRFELFQSITARPVKKCPACGKNKATRLIGTGAGMIFKGSGFYITDYRSESYKAAAQADGGNGSAASGGSNGSSSAGSATSSNGSTPSGSSSGTSTATSTFTRGSGTASKKTTS